MAQLVEQVLEIHNQEILLNIHSIDPILCSISVQILQGREEETLKVLQNLLDSTAPPTGTPFPRENLIQLKNL